MSNIFDKEIDLNIGPLDCVARQSSVFDPRILQRPALDETLIERSKYGEYGYMATVAQRIKEAMGPRAHLSAVQRESLDMIATNIARLVCGDPNDRDSWHDIQGYAKLAEDRIVAQALATS